MTNIILLEMQEKKHKKKTIAILFKCCENTKYLELLGFVC